MFAGAATSGTWSTICAVVPRGLGSAWWPGEWLEKKNCQDTDQAAAALILDLKQRGLLDETLVIWGGEFGRTPMVQGNGNDGRDNHPNAFSMWLAGGGIQRGLTLGASDELGFNVAQDPIHVRDLHATILHLLGFDHTRLSYPFQGLDQRLTGVIPARVVKKLLA